MGLIAGLFFCWSISVTRGLALLPDREYIMAFQRLNRAILNPLFFICFLGPMVLLPLCVWRGYQPSMPLSWWMLVGAAAVYFAGVMGLTMAGNVPMNDALDAFNVEGASGDDLLRVRTAFEGRWNMLNNIRTSSCVVSFGLTVVSSLWR